MKDDTVDFETHMTASRSRHCVRADKHPSQHLRSSVDHHSYTLIFGSDHRSALR
jgi:hypothetical protein